MQWPNRQTICICLQDLRHSTQELHSHLRAKTATLISALCFGVFGVVLVPLVTGMFSCTLPATTSDRQKKLTSPLAALMFSAITTPVNQLPTLWMPMLWCWGFGLIAFKYGVGMTLLNDEDSRQAIADVRPENAADTHLRTD